MNTLTEIVALDDATPGSESALEYAHWIAEALGTTVRRVAADALPMGDALIVVAGRSPHARSLVARSLAPILLTPDAPPRQRPPWRAIVPLSGKPDADSALAFAVGFAYRAGMQVIAAHVADPNAGLESGLEAAAQYADAPHHEYPHQLEEFVERAMPQCSPAERATLADLVLSRGDIIAELLTLVRERDVDMLVVSWQGRLAQPQSKLLERLLHALRCPLVVVKPVAHGPFRLNVGPALE